MSEIVLQKLIYPREEICPEWYMYFRGLDESHAVEIKKEEHGEKILSPAIALAKGEAISLETYFNAFSIAKWKKYTKISNLTLRLYAVGDLQIRGMQAVGAKKEPEIYDAWNDDQLYACIRSERREADASVSKKNTGKKAELSDGVEEEIFEYRLSFEKLYHQGIVYPDLRALSDTACLIGGEWITEIEESEISDVDIALGICTFRREEFVKKNVGTVVREIMENEASPLFSHLEVYISDNGQTLPEDTFSNSGVHLFPNKNAGGAGGFTRTMIEALMRRKDSPFTHIILMDDDIVLSTEVLERTCFFLRLMRPEYKKCMIGGEMFMLDKRYKQFEAGATWRGTNVRFYNKMWDLRRRDCVSANEEENPINYSGWWYSVIPTGIITEKNLPLPMFIHYDDMEYGVRNEENGTILLNGICVWHPQSVTKAATRMTYYDVRNMLIGTAGRPDQATAQEVIRHLTNRVIGGVIRYRYEDAEICYEAIRDFYRGPEYFKNLDILKKHDELTKFNYEYLTPEEAGADMTKLVDHTYRKGEKAVFLWGLFCWALPALPRTKVSGISDIGLPFTAQKQFHYDKTKQKGYMTERDYRRAWHDFREYCEIVSMIRKDHDKIMKQWADAKPELTSLPFWEKYLGI